MSIVAVRTALTAALDTITPALITVWPNIGYKPVALVPYQRVDILFAEPDNSEIGPNYMERGFMQVSLCYPINTGPDAAEARAMLLRQTFKRTASFSVHGITVLIDRTPEIVPAMIQDDRYVLPVRIRFRADIPFPLPAYWDQSNWDGSDVWN